MRAVLHIALVFLLGCAGTAPAPLQPAADDWPQEGGGPMRSYAARTSLQPPLRLRWQVSLSDELHRGGAIAVGGHVLVPTVRGRVDVLDCESGEDVMSLSAAGVQTGTPVYSGGRIAIAYGGPWGDLAVYDLAEEELLWTAVTTSLEAPLLLQDDRVYAVGYEGRVSCFGLADSSRRWIFDMPGRGYAGACMADSLLLCVSGSGDLFALSATSGAQRWRVPTGAALMASPSTDGRSVLAVNREGDCVLVDVESGRLRWKRSLGTPVYAAAAISGGEAFLAASDGSVRCIALDGASERWIGDAGGVVTAAPVVTEDVLAVCAQNGTVTIFDRATGAVLWTERLRERVLSPPLLYRGRLFVCGERGTLYCYEPEEAR